MNNRRRILLVGFMGAGKTTVARALARRLKDSCVSLDELVAADEGRGPRELIDEEGEDYFRAAETRALRRTLADRGARVIDAGGGAWTLARNRALVAARDDCLTVWLDAPFDLCWERITRESGGLTRPLARDRAGAAELYAARRAAYRSAALRVRVTRARDAEELAAEIMAAAGL
jgi:shikimate kinase